MVVIKKTGDRIQKTELKYAKINFELGEKHYES